MSEKNRVIPRAVETRVQNSLIYLILFGALLTLTVGVYRGGLHLAQLKAEDITIYELPSALALSLMRMSVSFVVSLVFAFALGLLAATNRIAERFIIPALDILQSVPVVGFFPAAISFFIGISSGHRIGIELAACFLIFTSQAWNMAFAVYEAIKTIPQDNIDAVVGFGSKGSLRFWRLYAPASVPRLVYNSMLSWSNGWFFLVACEIIAVGNVKYDLPGIGSFLARAAEQNEAQLVVSGLAALALLIIFLDLIVWRPFSIWAERFRQDTASGQITFSARNPSIASFAQWVSTSAFEKRLGPLWQALQRMATTLFTPILWFIREVLLPLIWDLPAALLGAFAERFERRIVAPAVRLWRFIGERAYWLQVSIPWAIGLLFGSLTAFALFSWLKPPWPEMVREIPLALLASTGRLIIAMIISLAWIIPLVLFSWNRPRLQRWLTTIAQIGASLPAVALFPLFIVVLIRRLGGGMEVASILLLLTSMQWYILFNCLGGAATIPPDLAEAIRGFGPKSWVTWRRLVLPSIRPALITGMVTAWGGGWNALFLSEYITYNNETLSVRGIGSLLNHAVYQLGDERSMTLCIAAMVAWILVINSLVWRPLYQTSIERYKLEG